MVKKSLFIFVVLCFMATYCFAVTNAKDKYLEAKDFVEKGQDYFAFMNFKNIVDEHPFSQWARKAEFALGEYFFAIGDLYDSINIFDNFLKKYKSGIDVTLANIYLLKIISAVNYEGEEKEKVDETIGKIRLNIFNNEHTELFSKDENSRFVTPYASPYNNRYEIFEYLSKVKIILNDKEFFTINQ